MRSRILSFFLVLLVLLSIGSTNAYACDERQTATYLGQMLFGFNAGKWASDERMIMLTDALYLCSEQANGMGQDKLDYLKTHKVTVASSIKDIDIRSDQVMEFSHKDWAYSIPKDKKRQNARKAILKNTVNTVFGTDLIDNTFGSVFGNAKIDKYENFAALLYYSHILFDYLADNPDEPNAEIRGRSVPNYTGNPYIEVNGNIPYFTEGERHKTYSFEYYSPLDGQKRAGVAFVNVSPNTMPPSGSRENIGRIWPTGWNQRMGGYPGLVNSTPPLLYNRCHLVAHQLSGNDTEENLITGTRFLNETGMRKFENQVADYVKATGNHVLYRATPMYVNDNELASGVQLEAYSVEDQGKGICFNVYCYNVQPGVAIDYRDGSNYVADMTYNNSDILPFISVNPTETDLISEIDVILAELFKDQVNTGVYQDMRTQIEPIKTRAMENGDQTTGTVIQYQTLNKIKHDYFITLKSHIPILLEREEFFSSVFK